MAESLLSRVCAACGKIVEGKYVRCATCKTTYCERACSLDDWASHKPVCKPLAAIVTGRPDKKANARAKEAVAFAVASCAADTAGKTCYVCLTGGPGLVRGCACRGTAGVAHVHCHVERCRAAFDDELRRSTFKREWTKCQTCGRDFQGPLALALATASWKLYSADVPEHYVARVPRGMADIAAFSLRNEAAQFLARAMDDNGRHEEALPWFRAVLAAFERLETANPGKIVSEELDTARRSIILNAKEDVATTLTDLGRHAEALAMLRETYTAWVEMHGVTAHDATVSSINLCSSLIQNGHNKEAQTLMRGALENARRLFGQNEVPMYALQLARALYDVRSKKAETRGQTILYDPEVGPQREDLLEAKALAEEALASARRIFGPSHPDTRRCESQLSTIQKLLDVRLIVERDGNGDAAGAADAADAPLSFSSLLASRRVARASEDAAKAEDLGPERTPGPAYVHSMGPGRDFFCDNCGVSPIVGVRYQCARCDSYDLCEACWHRRREVHVFPEDSLTGPHRFYIKRKVPPTEEDYVLDIGLSKLGIATHNEDCEWAPV